MLKVGLLVFLLLLSVFFLKYKYLRLINDNCGFILLVKVKKFFSFVFLENNFFIFLMLFFKM